MCMCQNPLNAKIRIGFCILPKFSTCIYEIYSSAKTILVYIAQFMLHFGLYWLPFSMCSPSISPSSLAHLNF